MTRLFTLILFFCFFISVYSQHSYKNKVDNLVFLVQNEKNEIKKLDYYIELGKLYFEDYDLENLRRCNDHILILAKKYNLQYPLAFYFMNKAYYIRFDCGNTNLKNAIKYSISAEHIFLAYKDLDNYYKASAYEAQYLIIDEQYDLAKKILADRIQSASEKKSKNITILYLTLSQLNNFISDYSNALIYANKAIEKNPPTEYKIMAYQIISGVYASLNNSKRATYYLNFAYSLSDSPHRKLNILFKKMEMYDRLQKYDEVLKLCLQNKKYFINTKHYAFTYKLMLARNYFYLKQYKEAEYYVDVLRKTPCKRRDVEIGLSIYKGMIALHNNDLKTAEIFINRALSKLKSNDYFELKINVYDAKSKLEERLKNYSAALHYNKKVSEIKDQTYSQFNKSKIQQLEIDFDMTQKDNHLKSLQISALIKDAEIKKKNQAISVFNYVLFVFFITILLLLFIYFNKKRKNKFIKDQNEKLENEKLLTLKSLREKEILLKELHHRVKNNMQLVISLLKIQSRSNQNIPIIDFIRISEQRIQSMALVHDYLYRVDNLNKINFSEYITKLVEAISLSFQRSKNIVFKNNIEKTAVFEIDLMIPVGLILNELITNSLKHAFKDLESGTISIELYSEDTRYVLNVFDNGIGFNSDSEIMKENKSVGLQIVKILASQINGTLKVSNISGAHISILLPKTNR